MGLYSNWLCKRLDTIKRYIAYTSKNFIRKFKSYSKQLCVTHDDVSIFSVDKTYLYKVDIGMHFPLISTTKNHYKFLVARVGKKKKSLYRYCNNKSKFCSKSTLKNDTKKYGYHKQ